MVDHPRSGGHRYQHERAEELDDQPDPQRPLSQGVFFEADQVAAAERLGVFGIHAIGCDACHGVLLIRLSEWRRWCRTSPVGIRRPGPQSPPGLACGCW
jgi:hypothetical protein